MLLLTYLQTFTVIQCRIQIKKLEYKVIMVEPLFLGKATLFDVTRVLMCTVAEKIWESSIEEPISVTKVKL